MPSLSETFPDTEILAFLSVSVTKEVPPEIQEKLTILVNGMTASPAMLPRLLDPCDLDILVPSLALAFHERCQGRKIQ